MLPSLPEPSPTLLMFIDRPSVAIARIGSGTHAGVSSLEYWQVMHRRGGPTFTSPNIFVHSTSTDRFILRSMMNKQENPSSSMIGNDTSASLLQRRNGPSPDCWH